MNSFTTFWNALPPVAQGFFTGAVFFSVLFGWQLLASVLGLGGDEGHGHADVGHDATSGDGHHGHDGTAAFKLLTLRSMLAFATLFTWAGGLYQSTGTSVGLSVFYASLWGFLALIVVSMLVHLVPRLTQSSNMDLRSALDCEGNVYLDIPENGQGEVRVLVSGAQTHVKALGRDGVAIKAGTPVRVHRIVDENVIEVEPIHPA